MSQAGTETAPRLQLLGRFRLEHDGPVEVSASARRLLAYLGLYRHATRTVLAGTLWPEVSEERAHGSLRTTLWRLHRDWCSPPLVVGSRGDMLALAESVTVDARALDDASPDVPPALLFQGDLLPGWNDDWVHFERERLRQLRLHALDALSSRLLAGGRHASALKAALESVRVEPLRESGHRAVVAVHLAEGNTAEAIRTYRAFAALLDTELGLPPSPLFTTLLSAGAVDRGGEG
ncbi:BTAD domain-containing putative transcriptional regulator [Streptomyces sp. ActVer]|uniref:AfsR/SARP family transcriptional regulator n=1 Tax=Streptomyces sp. ActVer TaxID=3014558 RepID=UPI0022B4F514|nr:BTAD domain-containing putative transcriptional regulator [Streptomyces sp. ActVer]MCZ4512471.1 BTAD domain-containing putative transcriptional regulator [Streptomyces sp. ActVer]